MVERECYVFENKVTGNQMYYPLRSYKSVARAEVALIEYDAEHLNDWEYVGIRKILTF